jgi:hypothetical protein
MTAIATTTSTPGKTRKPSIMQQGHSDIFQTDPWVLDALIPYLDPQWVIWEPSCGHGRLARGLGDRGFLVNATDTWQPETPRAEHPLVYWWKDPRDFLQWQPTDMMADYDCIVTNPPYSAKDDFLARAYELGKPFAFLLPYAALEGRKRQALYRQYGLELIVLPKRPTFTTPSGKVGGSWFACAWFLGHFGIGSGLTFWDGAVN